MSTTSYPSDLSEAQWKFLEPLLPPPKPGGRSRFQSLRDVLNAILYLTATGCSWRSLPHDFPNYNTVFGYFNRWKQEGIWELIYQQLREKFFDKIHDNFHELKVISADQAYSGVEYTSNVQRTYHRQLEIVKREKGSKGFQGLPVGVSLPFGWLKHFKRLSKDYG